MLNEASSPKDKLGLIYRIMLNVKNGEEGAITPEEQAYVDKVLAELKEQGYEMDNDGLIGGDYSEGDYNIVDDIQFVKPGDPRYDKLEDGQTVINRIIKPRILKDGKLYQAATVGAIIRSDTSVSSELYEAKKKLARLLRADNNNEIIQHQIAEIKAEIAVLEKKKAEELASKASDKQLAANIEAASAEVDTNAGEENEEIKPIGKGVFGNIYDQFKGKAKSAINFLRKIKSGEAVGALHHNEVGDISLVWGNDKAGLKKILRKHPEVVGNLQEILNDMHIAVSSENRIVLESNTHKAVVSKMLGEEKTPQWLLTAYEKKNASGGSSDIGPDPQRGKQNGTAPLQDKSSTDKDTESSPSPQENGPKKSPQAAVKSASAEVETSSTEAQKKAGNYKMGHVKVGAFDVTIENPKGSERSGTDANGKKWSVKMNNTYGYIRGTEGVDGDHIDVFLAEDMDKWDGKYVFVVDQYNPDGTFDEHKVMLGFNSMEKARSAYLANYEKGWENGRRIVVARIKTDDFQKWVDSSHRKTKPFAHYVIAGAADVADNERKQNSSPSNAGRRQRHGFKRPESATMSVEERFAKEKHGYYSGLYKEVIDTSNTVQEAVQKFIGKLHELAEAYKDWLSRKYKRNSGTVSAGSKYGELEAGRPMRIDEVNERHRVNTLRGIEKEAKDVEGYIHTLLERCGISKEESGKYFSESDRFYSLLKREEKPNGEGVAEDNPNQKENERTKAENKPNQNENDRATPSSTSGKVRMQKAQGYSEFAEKHGVNADDVRAYAEGMALGNVVMANQAFTEIRRTKRIEHRGMKLSEFAKAFNPIKEELYEKFGNVDELNQEYERRAEEERNMMEAARKKAEEEERKRQAHLDELSLLDDAAIDERYMEALQRGDEATAREMLDEAARRKGYGDTASDYQGVGAWVAPANPGYENDAERRADVEDNAPDVNIEDIALGYSLVDEKYWQEPRKYMQTDATAIESVNAIREAIAAVRRGEKNVKVKVYRAVPTSVKEGKLRNGDWVTPSKDYAKMHGEHRLEGKYRIIEDEVSVNELWWDGNDSREWGFDNGKGYKYKNVKNNRKSDDLVTRDDKGNVIPPSKRFNQRKADERYQKAGTPLTPNSAEVALRDAIADLMRKSGLEVLNTKEGQRVLDEAKISDDIRTHAMLSSLVKAANVIRGWLANNKRGKSFTIELPTATQHMVRRAMGRDFDSHNITANGVAHAQKNHGVGGQKLNKKSIPLTKADMELIPYIMTAPDYVRRGSDDVSGRVSVRFYKELSNGYVVVAEKEYKNSPDDMETITMWAEMSDKATNAQRKTAPDTHVQNAILDIDAAKIRKDAENAIAKDQNIREHRVYHGSGIRFFRTSNGEAYGFTVDGKIYIDPRIATAETPIHEYAHLWATAMREGNPTEWKNIVGLMKGTSVWAEVQKLYPELKNDDDIADEVLATFSGRRGAERLRAEQQKIMQGDGSVFEKAAAVGALARVKQALSKFWKGVADFLGIHYTSAEEVADRVMKDLLEGVDPRKFGVSGVLRESIRLPKTEYAKVAHAIATNKGLKNKGINWVFTDNNYYIYTANEDGYFAVEFGLPIRGNENFINELIKGIGNGTIRDTRSLHSVIERERSKPNRNNRNNADAEGRQRSTGRTGNLALRQQTNEARSDERLGSGLYKSPSTRNTDRRAGRETGGVDDNLYRQGEDTPHTATSSESKSQSAQKATENLNLGGRVVVHESAEGLEGKEATAKGWYDTKTGQIHVVLSNNADAADVTQTILHEAVAHHGLRELFGHNVMDAFLDSVLAAASQEVKDAINGLRRGNGWNFRTATEEYLAGLAERTDFERMTAEERGLFATIRRLFNRALEFLGLKNHELSDRELAYILWCSYQNLKTGEKGRYVAEAERIAMRYKLKAGKNAMTDTEKKEHSVLLRGKLDNLQEILAKDTYERLVTSGSHLERTAWVDMLSPLQDLQHAIEKNGGFKLGDFENPYNAYITMSSRNYAQMDIYKRTLYADMIEAIHALGSETGRSYEEIKTYVMAKHGMERQKYMAGKAAEEAYNRYKSMHPFGQKTLDYFIDEYEEKSFAGLTELFGTQSVSEAMDEAQKYVEEVEAEAGSLTDSMWNSIRAATKSSLQRAYEAGLISKETYDNVSSMYQYYIPLRGFDEATSDEVYEYFGDQTINGGTGSFMKKAKGRKSVADDPFAVIGNMAEMAIMQSNRNLMKQQLLNLALNHPSDLISVSNLYVKFDEDYDNGDGTRGAWVPVAVPDTSGMTTDEANQVMLDFQDDMEEKVKDEPDTYALAHQKPHIPYRVLGRNMNEHQVMVKRGGKTYILTINGNPRAAQAINGLLNPDATENPGAIALKAMTNWIARMATARNVEFAISNAMRDLEFSTTLIPKEGTEYYGRYVKNYLTCVKNIGRLVNRLNGNTLDMSNPLEKAFYDFIYNGGETGYTFMNSTIIINFQRVAKMHTIMCDTFCNSFFIKSGAF